MKVAIKLAEKGFDVVAIDVDEKAIKALEENWRSNVTPLNCAQAVKEVVEKFDRIMYW